MGPADRPPPGAHRRVAEAPDLTLAALRERLQVDVSLATLHNALVALKLTLKKMLFRPAESQLRPEVAQARAEFREFERTMVDPDRFVFINEAWVKTNKTRLYGHGPATERVIEYVPHGHWMTTTFVAVLRLRGLPHGRPGQPTRHGPAESRPVLPHLLPSSERVHASADRLPGASDQLHHHATRLTHELADLSTLPPETADEDGAAASTEALRDLSCERDPGGPDRTQAAADALEKGLRGGATETARAFRAVIHNIQNRLYHLARRGKRPPRSIF
jgi:hypothetical protein